MQSWVWLAMPTAKQKCQRWCMAAGIALKAQIFRSFLATHTFVNGGRGVPWLRGLWP